MGRSRGEELDKTDLMIIQELARDGRMPTKNLAVKAGICERVARNKIRRLTSEGIIKVVATPALPLMGVWLPAFVGFNIKPGHGVNAAAKELAAYPAFHSVALASGPYDIITWALFDGLEGLSAFLKHEVSNIPGISGSQTLISLETVKNVATTYRQDQPIPDKHEPLCHDTKAEKKYRPDALDALIIRELQEDGRLTAVELVRRLGISRPTAAKRLERLISEGVIQVLAVTRPEFLGYGVTAHIGINAFPGTVGDIAYKLASFDAVHFLAITAGHYDLLLGVHFAELYELSDFILDLRDNFTGVAKTESMIYLKIIKGPFEYVLNSSNDSK